MSKLGVLLPLHTDQETGCTGYGEEYQLCRQAFFAKQQNGLTKEQPSATLLPESKTIQTQQPTQPTEVQTPQGIILNGNIITATIFIFVVTIIVTIVITKRISTKRI